MAFITQNPGLLGLGFATLLALPLAFWYFRRRHQASQHECHITEVIDSLGVPSLHNVVLPDGIDGLAFIDYLLLMPKGIVVLSLEHREGLLFGGRSVDRWTQVINGKTLKFDNPLYTHPHQRQAVEWNTEDIATCGCVVFSNAGQFQKGIPSGCCMIDDLPAKIAPLLGSTSEIPKPLHEAWAHLQNLSTTSQAELGHQG
ncbi:MAG: NERD domain-containing protein [Gammaproteobacteria bacterium]|nr:NERD domain-containing protein [Gammaproteobacteria bacterium]MCF6361837.1 NERD domain-containing protein [Gammaproteobacteria bacterium]